MGRNALYPLQHATVTIAGDVVLMYLARVGVLISDSLSGRNPLMIKVILGRIRLLQGVANLSNNCCPSPLGPPSQVVLNCVFPPVSLLALMLESANAGQSVTVSALFDSQVN